MWRLDEDRDEKFKHIVTKWLYVGKKVRRLDIQLAVGYLLVIGTWVSCSTEKGL